MTSKLRRHVGVAIVGAALQTGCATPPPADPAQALVGTYRAVSLQGLPDGEPPVDIWGRQPRGHVVITPRHYTTLLTAQDRKLPVGPTPTPQELLASFVTQVAYSGPYRVEGDRLITRVEASSYASWVGTEQAREFRVEGKRLHLYTPRGPIPALPGKTGRVHSVWERIE